MTEPTAAPTGDRDAVGVGDLISGVAAVGFGVAVVLYVRGFPQLPDGAPGPALFPGILGGLFVLFGSVLVVRWARHGAAVARRSPEQRAGERQPAGAEPTAEYPTPAPISARTAWVNALSVVAAVLFYLLAAEILGFALTMGLLIFGLSWRLGARPLLASGSAAVTTGLLYVVFERVLLVPLPVGLLG